MNSSSNPILTNESDIISLMRKNLPPCAKDFICYYSSSLGAYLTDPLFMMIPLEDKIIHRGYAVFDTSKIFNKKIYQLDKHLDRFLKSISSINLNSKFTKEEYREILLRLASLAIKIEPTSDIELRFYYSAGLGTLSTVVKENMCTFYALATKTDYSVRPVNGISDFLVNVDEIKKKISTHMQKNVYKL